MQRAQSEAVTDERAAGRLSVGDNVGRIEQLLMA